MRLPSACRIELRTSLAIEELSGRVARAANEPSFCSFSFPTLNNSRLWLLRNKVQIVVPGGPLVSVL